VPFDPAKKMSEASAHWFDWGTQRIVKGAFAAVIGLPKPRRRRRQPRKELEEQGFRVLAVAAGAPTAMKLVGLIALSDPPRTDSAALVSELQGLGVRTVMVTGDAPATAAIVARAVGLDGAVCPPGPIPDTFIPSNLHCLCRRAAGRQIQARQGVPEGRPHGRHVRRRRQRRAGATPGADRHRGLTATDVAKSAAGMVLTEPGLAGIVAAVKEGRITFQRIQTYTLNSIIKKIVTVLFLIAGLIMTGQAILTPLLMVIVMVTGDFLAMSLDDGQRAAIPDAQCVAHRQLDGGRRDSWVSACWPSARRAGRRQIWHESGNRGAQNPGLRRAGVRQPGDDLCHSRTPALVGLSPEPVAGGLVHRRYRNRLDIGRRRNRHDALPALLVAGTLAAAVIFAFILDW
jgi:hypothetical protein